jgi:5-methylcytosine-specific restriction endonuclease McrA
VRLLRKHNVPTRQTSTFVCPLGNSSCRNSSRCRECRDHFNLCSGCQRQAAAPEAKQCISCLKKGRSASALQRKKNQRAMLREAPGKCSDQQWQARCEYFGWLCWYCRTPLCEETVTQDHRIPISKGGSNWPSNLVPACIGCNSAKGCKDALQFRVGRRELTTAVSA